MIAGLIAEKRLTCILDVSEFDTRSAMFRFLHDFAETLLKKNRHPLHVFCEEADDYLPQSAGKGASGLAECLGAWQRLIKRGRFRGIGSTLITQRTAAINKDVLNMAEVLFAMRVTAPHDRKAIVGWVQSYGMAKEIVDSLPGLADGEAWAWSPGWLKSSEKFLADRRTTFDSGKTPEIGKSVEPARLADIDLAAIKEQISATIEKAKADDPAELRKIISRLEKELREKKPIIDESATANAVEQATSSLIQKIDRHQLVFQEAKEIVERLRGIFDVELKGAYDETKSRRNVRPVAPVIAQPIAPPTVRALVATSVVSNSIAPRNQKVLDALARLESIGVIQPNRSVLGAVSKYSPKSSGFEKIVSNLSSSGLVTYPGSGLVSLTDEGRAIANNSGQAITLADLHRSWFEILEPRHGKILTPLIVSYPEALTREQLADQSGYSASSSGFEKAVSTLSSFGVVSYPRKGMVVATDLLFPTGIR